MIVDANPAVLSPLARLRLAAQRALANLPQNPGAAVAAAAPAPIPRQAVDPRTMPGGPAPVTGPTVPPMVGAQAAAALAPPNVAAAAAPALRGLSMPPGVRDSVVAATAMGLPARITPRLADYAAPAMQRSIADRIREFSQQEDRDRQAQLGDRITAMTDAAHPDDPRPVAALAAELEARLDPRVRLTQLASSVLGSRMGGGVTGTAVEPTGVSVSQAVPVDAVLPPPSVAGMTVTPGPAPGLGPHPDAQAPVFHPQPEGGPSPMDTRSAFAPPPPGDTPDTWDPNYVPPPRDPNEETVPGVASPDLGGQTTTGAPGPMGTGSPNPLVARNRVNMGGIWMRDALGSGDIATALARLAIAQQLMPELAGSLRGQDPGRYGV